MKQFFFFATLMLFGIRSLAQVINPGFEMIDPVLHTPAYWQPKSFMVVILDTNCTTLGADSTYFASTDAHSGNYAAEIRTAINCNIPYSGQTQQVRFNADTFADLRAPFSQRPGAFTFFYKLLPVSGDGAQVTISLEEADGTHIADALLTIYGIAPFYRKATIPLTYHSTATPEFLNMKLKIHNDTVVHFGSRFLIDDINTTPTGVTNVQQGKGIDIYPIPAGDDITLCIPDLPAGTKAVIRLCDITGKMLRSETVNFQQGKVHCNVQNLANGTYFIQTEINNERYAGRFVK